MQPKGYELRPWNDLRAANLHASTATWKRGKDGRNKTKKTLFKAFLKNPNIILLMDICIYMRSILLSICLTISACNLMPTAVLKFR